MPACIMQCRTLGRSSFLPTCFRRAASSNSSFFSPSAPYLRLVFDGVLGKSGAKRSGAARMMGGGPRTYPGGMSKWEWNRLNEQKKKEWEQARRIRERQVFKRQQSLGVNGVAAPKKEQEDLISQLSTFRGDDETAVGSVEISPQGYKFRKVGGENSHRKYPARGSSPSILNGINGGLPLVNNRTGNELMSTSQRSNGGSPAAGISSNSKDSRSLSSSAVVEKAANLDFLDENFSASDRPPGRRDAVKRRSSITSPLMEKRSQKGKPEDSDESEDEFYGPRGGSQTAENKSEPSHLSQSRFDQFKLSALSIRALHEVLGYERMTIVQEATLPVILQGKDVLAKAKTGTGKTIAFLLPAIEQILQGGGNQTRQKPIEVLVICPARELAMQAGTEAATLMKYHKGLGVQVVIGGTNIVAESTKFKTLPCQVLVATPGRLLDHMQKTPEFISRLKGLKVLVLDEADRLLDMGFRDSILSILKHVSKERQTLLFSATIPKEVHSMSKIALKPDHSFIDTVGDEEETHALVKQQHVITSQDRVLPVMYSLLKRHIDEEPAYKVLVFCTTANITALMAAVFTRFGWNIREIHSRKTQSYRTKVSDEFRKSKGKIIMFTSDVSARGIDYPDVTFVLQIGLPSSREQYIHRLGRTGRAGKEGQGVLLLLPWEKPFLKSVQDLSIEALPAPDIDSEVYRQISKALSNLDEQVLMRAYQSWLGYYRSCQLDLDKRTLVQLARQFSAGIGMDEPPILDKNTIRKMGLTGVL